MAHLWNVNSHERHRLPRMEAKSTPADYAPSFTLHCRHVFLDYDHDIVVVRRTLMTVDRPRPLV